MGTHAGELTPFHQRFIAEYMLDLNATAAYIRAGGTGKAPGPASWAMMQRSQVKEEIASRWALEREHHEQALATSQVTREWVIEHQKTLVERCMQEVPVLDADGKEKGVWRFDAAGALGGLALMRKDLGMDRVEPSGGDTYNFNGPNPFMGWNMEELVAWREAHRAKIVEGKIVHNDAA